MNRISLNTIRAERHLMDLLRIEGQSGREREVAECVMQKLAAAGVPRSSMKTDTAHRRIPGDFETGNLIIKIPGDMRAPRRMFMGHLDTVPLCRGAIPVKKGHRIVAKGATAVRADNRTAVAAVITLAEEVLSQKLPHPPLTLLFTVGEEIGLYGAKYLRPADVGNPAMAFNFDSGDPREIITGAIGAVKWTARIRGISSHAGMHPEQGVSAILIASRAIEQAARGGWFGLIRKGRRHGTSNAGIISGGAATNQVADEALVHGECRSHDPAFLKHIVAAWTRAFRDAARSVSNHEGAQGRVEFECHNDYASFRMSDRHPAVQFALAAARSLGWTPRTVVMNGGLDANPLNDMGIPTITLGAGQHGAHSVKEYVDLPEYFDGCRLGIALATQPIR
ncbi:MAG: M20/M25/M40 family metallo-hydrolase [Kiritimatiellae bacterium]|nr:M20/M25/M40 family metallo-hydrolase [Kiritimatiellia bacterium]